MDYSSSRKSKSDAVKPVPDDRADDNFVRLLPSGNTTAQEKMPPAKIYHVNHFICYFTINGKTFTDAGGRKAAGILTYRFLKNFCLIFSQHNIARAQIGPRGRDVFNKESIAIEFTIGSNVGTFEHRAIGFFHPDWVAMSSVPSIPIDNIADNKNRELKSFHGDTLKRLWNTEVEEKIISGGLTAQSLLHLPPLVLLPEPFPALLAAAIVKMNRYTIESILEFNRQHFLAGTRSWRVGYDSSRKHFLVETIAIERFSCAVYAAMELKHSTRADVIDLWNNLLNNFINTKALNPYRFTLVPAPDELTQKKYGYTSPKAFPHIWHSALQYKDLVSLKKTYNAKDLPVMNAIRDWHEGLRVHVED